MIDRFHDKDSIVQGKCHDVLKKSSSEPIKNEVLTITSEHPSSEDQFERKFQAKVSTYDQIFEKQEEELKEFKE